jgi:Sperm-tail PG-rich repeat
MNKWFFCLNVAAPGTYDPKLSKTTSTHAFPTSKRGELYQDKKGTPSPDTYQPKINSGAPNFSFGYQQDNNLVSDNPTGPSDYNPVEPYRSKHILMLGVYFGVRNT